MYTNGDVVDIIANEGLQEAVRHYMGPEHIEDKDTARLWQEAEDSLNTLLDRLYKQTGREEIKGI